ncbi:hypothetical protein BH11BAC1_BH11BAC1_13110 [soil metagenome]
MIKIIKSTEKDFREIAAIGKITVEEAHRDSCSAAELNEYLENNYNDDAIKKELSDIKNIYNIIYFKEQPAGFSKIIFNCSHPNIQPENVAKLDRIYLLKEYHNLKLGYELLKSNLELSKNNGQEGVWLFTWIHNKKAVNFYLKTGFTIIGTHQFKVTETRYNPNHHMYFNLNQDVRAES